MGSWESLRNSADGKATNVLAGSKTRPIVDSWYHIVMVANPSKISIYVNDVDDYDSSALSTDNTIPSDFNNTKNDETERLIGTRGAGSIPGYFQGKIDDIRIYNRVLSESEIQLLYNESN